MQLMNMSDEKSFSIIGVTKIGRLEVNPALVATIDPKKMFTVPEETGKYLLSMYAGILVQTDESAPDKKNLAAENEALKAQLSELESLKAKIAELEAKASEKDAGEEDDEDSKNKKSGKKGK